MQSLSVVSRTDSIDKAAFETAFAELPDRVRRGDYRTGLLPGVVWRSFRPGASRNGGVLDRPSRRQRADSRQRRRFLIPSCGAVGFFEVDLSDAAYAETAKMLLASASQWLHMRGVTQFIGPLDLNTWFPYRFRTDFEDKRFFTWEPVNPPEYPRLFVENGFRMAQEYHSVGTSGLAAYAEKTEQDLRKALEGGFNFSVQ